MAPLECIPAAPPLSHSFDTLVQESDRWAQPDLFLAETDWNILSIDPATPFPTGFDGLDLTVHDTCYGVASTFPSLSDSESIEPQTLPPASLVPSSAGSQGQIVDSHSNMNILT